VHYGPGRLGAHHFIKNKHAFLDPPGGPFFPSRALRETQGFLPDLCQTQRATVYFEERFGNLSACLVYWKKLLRVLFSPFGVASRPNSCAVAEYARNIRFLMRWVQLSQRFPKASRNERRQRRLTRAVTVLFILFSLLPSKRVLVCVRSVSVLSPRRGCTSRGRTRRAGRS